MKYISQSLKTGAISIDDAPIPTPLEGQLVIQSTYSIISSGTEKMLLDFGKSNVIEKIKKQPDKVKEVINKVKSDGLIATYDAVNSKLENPIYPGYANVGRVIAIGKNVKGFNVGDRVVSNGSHAEFVAVPQNLCAVVPPNVSDKEASFTVLASIGLQGIRLSKPTFGESFLVIGLGLIGLLTCQILKSQGINVLGLDPDKRKSDLAKKLGVNIINYQDKEKVIKTCFQMSSSSGIDGTIITASTSSNDPIEIASNVTRQRGRIILIGSTKINLKRDLFYKKELSFQVSCSYGPGRYDKNYEDNSIDYPLPFVRWTENRNFKAILKAFESKLINTNLLISHEFSFNKAMEAYNLLNSDEYSLAILLNYGTEKKSTSKTIEILSQKKNKLNHNISKKNKLSLGFIGCGNYASRVLIPAFRKTNSEFSTLVSPSGSKLSFFGKKFLFSKISSDVNSIFKDDSIDAVVIATRHDTHFSLVKESLLSGKSVFVEKPLCMNMKEINSLKEIYSQNQILMVGFNRRFAPLIKVLKSKLDQYKEPKSFVYTCNAGYISEDNWIQDDKIGGGRIIGEACHFVDLIRFLAGSEIIDLKLIKSINNALPSDTFTLQLRLSDGSLGTIHYLTNGHKSFPKERIDVFTSGCVFQLDNFRKLNSWGEKLKNNRSRFIQDKGQFNCAVAFVESILENKKAPIPFLELIEVHSKLFGEIE